MANSPDINDPAKWQQWLNMLQIMRGVSFPNMAPGSNTLFGPPPPANMNRTIRPVAQNNVPGPLSAQMFPNTRQT